MKNSPMLLWWAATNAWLVSIGQNELVFGQARRFYERGLLPGEILRELFAEK